MEKLETDKNRFSELGCCVLIPTYNNAKTLKSVLQSVLAFTQDVLVVNDGSTDDTSVILEQFPEVKTISFPTNQGKGSALRTGLKSAEEHGFQHAICLDSDGQHFAEDIAVFLTVIEKQTTPTLWIGSRQMNGPEVPKKSNFGNRFSNFWFWIETGIRLDDTQCGFRVYPLKEIKTIRTFTKRFEYEIEIIVKAAWRGLPIKNVPIRVHYDQTERVSHFRPWQDFTRISFLNTYLVLLTIFYHAPKRKYLAYRAKGWKRFWKEEVLKNSEPPLKKALAVALGVFFGIAPFWGFQTVLVLLFAKFLNLNKAVSFLFSNISIPPFIPVIAYASFQTGAIVMGENPNWNLSLHQFSTEATALKGLWQYVFGSFVLAAFLSFSFGITFYFLFSIFRKK